MGSANTPGYALNMGTPVSFSHVAVDAWFSSQQPLDSLLSFRWKTENGLSHSGRCNAWTLRKVLQ